MLILLTHDWKGPGRDGVIREHKAGETISVKHFPGRDLIYGRIALWVAREEGDPEFTPVDVLCAKAAVPKVDRMMRSAVNR